MELDHVRARLGGPAGAERVVLGQLLAIAARRGGAGHAHDEELLGAQLGPGALDVGAPGLGGRRGQPHRHGERQVRRVGASRWPRYRHRRIPEAARQEIGRRRGRLGGRADRLVGEDSIAQARIGLDPLRAQQRPGGDADRRGECPVEEADGRRGTQLARARRQLGRVRRVPREGPVDAVGGQAVSSRDAGVQFSSGIIASRSGSKATP